ncbi:MAG TPA: hypothetical protein VMT76_01990 [Puia sp.]|nr:hypothetical protein [Puia sp.]
MKKFIAGIMILVTIVVMSCNSSSGSANNAVTKQDNKSNADIGNAENFYCKIDAKEFSANSGNNTANAVIKTSPGVINFVLVTITSSDASGVKGTFSGTLRNEKDDKDVTVTDGRFDLPYSSYSQK